MEKFPLTSMMASLVEAQLRGEVGEDRGKARPTHRSGQVRPGQVSSCTAQHSTAQHNTTLSTHAPERHLEGGCVAGRAVLVLRVEVRQCESSDDSVGAAHEEVAVADGDAADGGDELVSDHLEERE